MSKFVVMKVFDCQDMPDELRARFFKLWDHKHNDSSVTWEVNEDTDPDQDTKDVNDWLVANGANPEGESVIIQYWW